MLSASPHSRLTKTSALLAYKYKMNDDRDTPSQQYDNCDEDNKSKDVLMDLIAENIKDAVSPARLMVKEERRRDA